jgi:hypothetical protein
MKSITDNLWKELERVNQVSIDYAAIHKEEILWRDDKLTREISLRIADKICIRLVGHSNYQRLIDVKK